MPDRRRTSISSVMTANKNGASPDKRRKHDEAFKAEALRLAGGSRSTQAAAQQLGIRPKLLYRWKQAQLVAEVGSEEVARGPKVRALRVRLKRAEQELDILKKPWSSSASPGPGEHLPAHRPAVCPRARAPALPSAANHAQRLLCLAPAAGPARS
jgi:transposase